MALFKELKQRGFTGFRLLDHVGLYLILVVKRTNDFVDESINIKRTLFIC